jgi:hypothetical protein
MGLHWICRNLSYRWFLGLSLEEAIWQYHWYEWKQQYYVRSVVRTVAR